MDCNLLQYAWAYCSHHNHFSSWEEIIGAPWGSLGPVLRKIKKYLVFCLRAVSFSAAAGQGPNVLQHSNMLVLDLNHQEE